jgi:hypothetical protein
MITVKNAHCRIYSKFQQCFSFRAICCGVTLLNYIGISFDTFGNSLFHHFLRSRVLLLEFRRYSETSDVDTEDLQYVIKFMKSHILLRDLWSQ